MRSRSLERRYLLQLVLVAVCFLFAFDRASMQTQTAADGPWSGSAQCVLTAQFVGQGQTYSHQQTHTWVLTGSTPLPTSSSAIKQYAATWQVTGQGTRQRGQGNSEQWTTAGQPMPDTLTIRLTAEGTVRIGGAAQLRSTGTTTGAAIPYVDEWTFPVIEGAATQTTISGSAPQGLSANFPGAPPGTTSTAACSWRFERGATAAMTPPPATGSVAQAPPSPAQGAPSTTTVTIATPAGMATATAGGTTSGTTSKDTTRQEVLSSGSNTALTALFTGPAPTNVRVIVGGFTHVGANSGNDGFCFQAITVIWDPVPGATGYTIYIEGSAWGSAPAGATRFDVDYPLEDISLVTGNSSFLTSAAQVGASFDNRIGGVSAPVSFTHLTKC